MFPPQSLSLVWYTHSTSKEAGIYCLRMEVIRFKSLNVIHPKTVYQLSLQLYHNRWVR